MEPARKNGNKKGDHNALGSAITFSQKKPEKSGLFKKFLDWIAKGAKEASMGVQSCPS